MVSWVYARVCVCVVLFCVGAGLPMSRTRTRETYQMSKGFKLILGDDRPDDGGSKDL
jgi:hypothetical protein